jgi:hypothetical protein
MVKFATVKDWWQVNKNRGKYKINAQQNSIRGMQIK